MARHGSPAYQCIQGDSRPCRGSPDGEDSGPVGSDLRGRRGLDGRTASVDNFRQRQAVGFRCSTPRSHSRFQRAVFRVFFLFVVSARCS